MINGRQNLVNQYTSGMVRFNDIQRTPVSAFDQVLSTYDHPLTSELHSIRPTVRRAGYTRIFISAPILCVLFQFSLNLLEPPDG